MHTQEIIQIYYDAFNQGENGREKFLSLLGDDVIHDINQGGCEIGKQKFAAFMQVMDAHYQERIEQLTIMVNTDGSRAAAEFVVHGKYLKTAAGLPPANGQTYSLPVGAFFEIKNGKIARVTNYYNLQNWLDQVK